MTTPDSVLSAASGRTCWPLVPLWSIARREDRVGQPDAELLSVYREHGVIRRADRDDNYNRASENLSDYKVVQKGGLVLTKMKTWQGSLGVSDYDGIVSPAYFTCSISPHIHGRYLHYLLRSSPYIALYAAASKGIRPNQWDLPYDDFRALPAMVPPVEEQRRIADFLDDQVARIDNIIAARRRQIAMIKASARSQMQDLFDGSSARTRPLATLTDAHRPIQYGIVLPGPDFPGGIPIVKGGDVAAGRVHSARLNRTDPVIESKYARSRLRGGDLVISIRGSVGDVDVVPDALTGANLTQDAARVAPFGCDPDWLRWALELPLVQSDMRRRVTGAMVPGINIEALRAVRIPDTPLAHQGSVGKAVGQVMQATRRHVEGLDRSNSLMQELKQSLITSAVAGEFDVSTADGSRVRG